VEPPKIKAPAARTLSGNGRLVSGASKKVEKNVGEGEGSKNPAMEKTRLEARKGPRVYISLGRPFIRGDEQGTNPVGRQMG